LPTPAVPAIAEITTVPPTRVPSSSRPVNAESSPARPAKWRIAAGSCRGTGRCGSVGVAGGGTGTRLARRLISTWAVAASRRSR